MTRIDERDLVLISGCGDAQDVQPELGTAPFVPPPPPPRPPVGTNPPAGDGPTTDNDSSGSTRNLQQ